MKFRILSDLHIEFNEFVIPPDDDDINTVLILAGDCYLFKRHAGYALFLEMCSKQFKHVVLVPGNHEYFGTNIHRGSKKVRAHLSDISNISILEKETLVLDGVAIIGATLWADFDRDELVRFQAQEVMNDYRKIRHGPVDRPWLKKLHSLDTLAMHIEHRKFIFDRVVYYKEMGLKTVVVSHHGPTNKSIADRFIGDSINGAYVSDLSEQILDTGPNLWVHGHVHNNFDYTVGATRVVCNPRGYYHSVYGVENGAFDEMFTVVVK